MSKIRVLPEVLANKIAAGEIVERPASVVKELVENSIDAGARAIFVATGSGGKKLITVRDDGEGMSQDDAILAFEHHATSKLQSADDLAAIATLGFRGEALPSIASISRLALRSRSSTDAEDAPGTQLEIQGGTLRSVKPISWHKGTEISIRDLFFNVPARRKFLRSHETELSHITRLVTHYALAHPEIRFTLESDGRTLLDAVPVGSVRERIFQVFGEGFLENLVEIVGAQDSVRIHGFSSRPQEQRTNPYSQFFYVNRRMVRDKVIAGALRNAYRHCMPSSAYPVAIVFVELPFDQVDVNAHPAKTEIRFRNQALVHDLIRGSIESALVKGRAIPDYEYRAADPAQQNVSPEKEEFGLIPTAAASSQFQKAFEYPFREVVPVSERPGVDHTSLRLRPELLLGADGEPTKPFYSGAVRIIGQIYDSYVIGVDSYGLLIIDQHVAHERILYEKLAAAMESRTVERQGLLVPLAFELPPHQTALLNQVLPELNRNGFQIEFFGGNTVLIRSVPALVGDQDCRKMLAEILEGLGIEERTLDVKRIRDRLAVGMACRAAIKVHMPLSMEKMQWLLDELALTRIPTSCPHGRPVILRFSLYEIERNFGRA